MKCFSSLKQEGIFMGGTVYTPPLPPPPPPHTPP